MGSMAEDIARVEQKIDGLKNETAHMATAVATMATRVESYPLVSAQVADHENRLTALETLEVRKYNERLQRLESSVSGFRGWLAGATAVGATVGGIVVWLLARIVPG